MTGMIVATKLNPLDSLNLDLWEGAVNTASLPLQELKYCPLAKAYLQLPDEAANVLHRMLGFASDDSWERMKLLVDYKVRDLKEGDCGCALDFWHLDVTSNPNHPTNPDIHYLYATDFGTEFITTPMDFFEDDVHFTDVLERNKDFVYATAKPNTISKYTRFNLHRGPIVTRDCRRMLLRLTLTEVI